MSPRGALMIACLACCGVSGCQRHVLETQVAVDCQVAYAQSQDAIQAGNYAAAADLLHTALDGGGLPPDMHSEAALERSICLARIGQHDEALAELDLAEQGPINPARVHMARAYVLRKQGRIDESKREVALGKKLDRSVTPVKD